MIEKIKAKFLNRQFLSFAFIGAFNTVGSMAIYMIAVSLGVVVSVSSLLGDTITMLFSYFLNMKFTYNTKPSLKSFVAFPLSYIPGFILNMIITVVMVDMLGVPELFGKAVALPITIPLNFVMMSLIVKWSKKNETAN